MKARYMLSTLAILLVPIAATAQEEATIVGTVTDPSGAAANITITNSAKELTHQYISNSVSEYTAADIPIGEYKVEAQATGFRVLARRGRLAKILKIEG
jgi:hypothetical protein